MEKIDNQFFNNQKSLSLSVDVHIDKLSIVPNYLSQVCLCYYCHDNRLFQKWINLYIVFQRLEREYNAKCVLGKPKVAFRETLATPCQ